LGFKALPHLRRRQRDHLSFAKVEWHIFATFPALMQD
jgi:hypothetical protein